MTKYLLPILALAGALLGLATVFWSQRSVPVAPVLFAPPSSPYPHFIAAAGIVEASSQNISIGTPFNEIITHIYVKESDRVKRGDPLFQLDIRHFLAQLESAKAAWTSALVEAEDRQQQYSFYERLQDKRSVSEQAYQQARYAYAVARQQAELAQRQVEEVQTNIERSTIRAPIDGEILQVNIHVGEIAPVIPFISSQSTWLTAANGTLILMGNVTPLQMRVDIDEADAWRFKEGSAATAFVRGNSNIHFPMQFVRVEPYIIPKTSFTGQTAERVDTRVLQVLYQFERDTQPIYAGQILDVFIAAAPIEMAARPPSGEASP